MITQFIENYIKYLKIKALNQVVDQLEIVNRSFDGNWSFKPGFYIRIL